MDGFRRTQPIPAGLCGESRLWGRRKPKWQTVITQPYYPRSNRHLIPGLSTIRLYIEHSPKKKTQEGLWFVTFDGEVKEMPVTYILKHEFIKQMNPNGFPSLIDKPLSEAIPIYLDFVFDMYKKK